MIKCMTDTISPLKVKQSAEIAQHIKAFLKSGGRIKRCPPGESNAKGKVKTNGGRLVWAD